MEFRKSRRANSKITGEYNQNIQGVRVVKALGREDENLKEFSVLTDDMYQASYRAAWLSALFLPTVQIISAFALGAIVWYGGMQSQTGAFTVGEHPCLCLLPDLHDLADPGPGACLCRNAAFHRLGRTHLQAARYAAGGPGPCRRPVPADTMRGEIEFDHVHFYYEDRKPVLTDFYLESQTG